MLRTVAPHRVCGRGKPKAGVISGQQVENLSKVDKNVLCSLRNAFSPFLQVTNLKRDQNNLYGKPYSQGVRLVLIL